MAAITIYAQADGNWDASNNWNTVAAGGGTAYTNPQNGADAFTCYANGKTITMNVDVTVTTLSTLAGAGTAGGGFTTSGQSGITITATAEAGSGTCVTLVSGTASELVGDSYGSTTTNNRQGVLVNDGCLHTGNSYGGNSSGCYGTYCTGTAIQNGNSTGGSAGYAYGTYLRSGGIQNGNSVGGSATNAHGTACYAGGIQNGNSLGGSAGNAYGTYCHTGGIQNGNSVGGSATDAYGTLCLAGGIQCGNASQSATNAASGTYIDADGMAFIGTATGSSAGLGYGITSALRGIVLIKTEVGAYAKSLNAATQTTDTNVPMVNYGATTYGDNDASKVLTTATNAGTYQAVAAADVRYGTAVGVSPATGSLEIPNSGTPTGTQDATSDACVVSGKKYGSPQRTGSASGGGGIIPSNMNGGMNG